MLKISVCPAVPEDATAIAAFNESCFGAAYPETKVRRELERLISLPGERVLVAVYRGEPVGYVHASSSYSTYRAPRKMVRTLAVDREFRRKGVGTALWRAVEAWASEDGCDTVTACTRSTAGAQFCLHCGCAGQPSRHCFARTLTPGE